MVQGKVLNWFDFREYGLFRWLEENTPSLASWGHGTLKPSDAAEVWEDRTVAQETIKKYLAEYPCESTRSRRRNPTRPSSSLYHHVYPWSAG